jgi:hypothetical protein
MALGTQRNFTVSTVAEATSQGTMLALDLLQLDNLRRMAGETLVGNIVSKFDNFWCMGIGVTTETIS